MIIVLGAVTVPPAMLEEAFALGQQHVERSRNEPGCLSHAVYKDPETAGRLVFVEEWADREALNVHFAVPASIEFVQTLGAMATEAPSIRIYTADPA